MAADTKSTAAQNATWRKAAIASGSPCTYDVVNTHPLGVGRYIPTTKEPPKAK